MFVFATSKSYFMEDGDSEALRYNSELYSDNANHCYRCSEYANCTFSIIVR